VIRISSQQLFLISTIILKCSRPLQMRKSQLIKNSFFVKIYQVINSQMKSIGELLRHSREEQQQLLHEVAASIGIDPNLLSICN
jgi:hypothetical protein